MANLRVIGGKKLTGKVMPSGNKNSALPIICATLMTTEPVTIRNVPELLDVKKLVEMMQELGSKIEWDTKNCVLKIHNDEINLDKFEGQLPVNMRGSVLLYGPLTARLKKFKLVTEIGGCVLGIRELDTHFEILKALGAKLNFTKRQLDISIDDRFTGNFHWADFMSVTTTENFAMAAATAKGTSTMVNAASEPHVQELCEFLNSMGAKITGIGSSKLIIGGVDSLGGTDYTLKSDHHEIATFLALGAMTGGRIEVENAVPEHFPLIVRSFQKMGVEVKYRGDTAIVEEGQKLVVEQPYTDNFIVKIEVAPWPYFPHDIMPLMMALATKSKGEVLFWNKVYYGTTNLWIPQLMKYGVKLLECDPHRVLIFGGKPLSPAIVDAPEIIRATVALFMIGASVEGESLVRNADSIKRAHPHFAEKLQALGADVKWEE